MMAIAYGALRGKRSAYLMLRHISYLPFIVEVEDRCYIHKKKNFVSLAISINDIGWPSGYTGTFYSRKKVADADERLAFVLERGSMNSVR
jgi:hypothetical protein